jgi:succinylglutamic semialdehyde dehydrogenase
MRAERGHMKAAETLANHPSDYIGGRFIPIAGDSIVSRNPASPGEIIWTGSPRAEHVDLAVSAARRAWPAWSSAPIADRIDLLRRWQKSCQKHADAIAGLITDEMGKILTESRMEASGLSAKVDITLDEHSMSRVREYEVPVSATRAGFCRFKSHGVMAVIAPFNFPAHLANGHFVPALLMGNTVILKPSDKVPAVGQMIAEMMHEAGTPPGVFNVVQGGGEVASRLVNHDDIDGILFTGSWPVGRTILEANLDQPGRIIALEMGGNAPAVVMPSANLKQAVIECVRATFATTGQRCTCTRRIIVHRAIADRFIRAFCKSVSLLLVGPGRSEEPVFMGPVVNEQSAEAVLHAQSALLQSGARVLVQATRMDRPGAFVTPSVVEVDSFSLDRDDEVFGPLAQICVVENLDGAIQQANMTRYGLVSAIFTNDEEEWRRFFRESRAGCINWNNGTAGASSKLPFGGIGFSGNHRPAGAFSVDYCAYPVANMVEKGADASIPEGMTWDDRWTR